MRVESCNNRRESQIIDGKSLPPAAVISTLVTSISLPPPPTFSGVKVAIPRLTNPEIMLPLKPCAVKSDCVTPGDGYTLLIHSGSIT
jgi:hypothetical protein